VNIISLVTEKEGCFQSGEPRWQLIHFILARSTTAPSYNMALITTSI